MSEYRKHIKSIYGLIRWYKKQQEYIGKGDALKEGKLVGPASTYFRPSEQEVIAHIVVPSLKLMGLKEKRITLDKKVWKKGDKRKIDIAIFDKKVEGLIESTKDPRKWMDKYMASIKMIIEVKNPSIFTNEKGHKADKKVKEVRKQTYNYTKPYKNCKTFATTDGYIYFVYNRRDKKDDGKCKEFTFVEDGKLKKRKDFDREFIRLGDYIKEKTS